MSRNHTGKYVIRTYCSLTSIRWSSPYKWTWSTNGNCLWWSSARFRVSMTVTYDVWRQCVVSDIYCDFILYDMFECIFFYVRFSSINRTAWLWKKSFLLFLNHVILIINGNAYLILLKNNILYIRNFFKFIIGLILF